MKSAEIKLLTHFEDFFSSNMYLLFIKDQNMFFRNMRRI